MSSELCFLSERDEKLRFDYLGVFRYGGSKEELQFLHEEIFGDQIYTRRVKKHFRIFQCEFPF